MVSPAQQKLLDQWAAEDDPQAPAAPPAPVGSGFSPAQQELIKRWQQEDTAQQDTFDQVLADTGKALVRGAGRGIASTPDMLMAGAQGVVNLVRRTADQPLLDQAKTPGRDWYNARHPPDPRYPVMESAGEIAGPTAVTLGAGGLLSAAGRAGVAASGAPAIVSTLASGARQLATGAAKTGAITAGTMAGEKVGENIARGRGELAQTYIPLISSIIGGGMPEIVASRVHGVAGRRYLDDTSLGKLHALDASGVRPDLSLVGNKLAAEAAARGNPAKALRLRRTQQTAMDRNAGRIGTLSRGGAPPPERPITSPAELGEDIRPLAQEAAQRAADRASGVYQPMLDRVGGRNAIVDAERQAQTLAELRAAAEPTYGAPAIVEHEAALRKSRTGILDAAIELELQRTKADAEAARAAAQHPNDATYAQSAADNAEAALLRNRGPRFGDVMEQRAAARRAIEAGGDPHSLGQIIDAQTETLGDAAAAKGVTDFDTVNAEYARLKEQQALLEPLTEAPQGQVFNKLLGRAGSGNLDLFRAVQENAPHTLEQVLGSNLEFQMRGDRMGSPEAHADAVAAATPKWWRSLPEEARQMAGGAEGSPLRSQIEAHMTTLEAEAARPEVSLRQSGQNIGRGRAALTGLMSLLGFDFGTAALSAAAFPSKARLTSRLARSPSVTRWLVEPRNVLQSQNLAGILAAAAGAQQNH